MSFLSKVFLIFLFLGLSSCVGDLDLDQVDDFEITPEHTISLINFEFDTEELEALSVDGGHTPVDELAIPISRDLEKVVFEFEASNPFDGDFEVVLNLLNSSNAVIYSFDTITLTANTTEIDVPGQEINLKANSEIYNATQIRGALSYGGSSTATTIGIVSFKSAGTFYYTIE